MTGLIKDIEYKNWFEDLKQKVQQLVGQIKYKVPQLVAELSNKVLQVVRELQSKEEQEFILVSQLVREIPWDINLAKGALKNYNK